MAAIKVRATRKGYYDLKRIPEGKIFMIKDEKHFSKKWMEKVSKAAMDKPVADEKLEASEDESPGESTGNAEVI